MSTPTSTPTEHPHRVQRKRIKGWRMPENTVSVTRPGRFGNPFTFVPLELSLALFENMARGVWDPFVFESYPLIEAMKMKDCYKASNEWRKRFGIHPTEAIRMELRGKNLACFCPLDQPCHGDILLRIANEIHP